MTETGAEGRTDPLGSAMENTTILRQPAGVGGVPGAVAAPATDTVPGRVYAAAAERVSASPGAGRGRTAIAEDVVEQVIQKIVDLTVDEVAGVHALHPGVETFFVADPDQGAAGAADAEPTGADDRAVTVHLDGDRAEINVAIEVEFGHAVHEVVEQVRASVISSAERLLGLTVTEVNVVVAAVSFEGATDR